MLQIQGAAEESVHGVCTQPGFESRSQAPVAGDWRSKMDPFHSRTINSWGKSHSGMTDYSLANLCTERCSIQGSLRMDSVVTKNWPGVLLKNLVTENICGDKIQRSPLLLMKNSTLFSTYYLEWQCLKVMAMGSFVSCMGWEQTGFLPVPSLRKDGDWALPLAPCASPRVLGCQVRDTKPKSWKESGILEMKLLQFSHPMDSWIASWQCSTPIAKGAGRDPWAPAVSLSAHQHHSPSFHTRLRPSFVSLTTNSTTHRAAPGCFISHLELKQIHPSRKAMNKFPAELHSLNCNKSFLGSYYH